VRILARSFNQEALKMLVEMMRDRELHAHVRIKAAQAVLDRGLGLPTQPVDVMVSRVLAKRLCECSIAELRSLEQYLAANTLDIMAEPVSASDPTTSET
jgi:hypothetical protein